MVKSMLTVASQKKLAKIVTMNELKTGASCTDRDSRRSWELDMIRKYGLGVI